MASHADRHDARLHPQQVALLYLYDARAGRRFLADLDAAELHIVAAEIQIQRGATGTWQNLQTIEDELTRAVSPNAAPGAISTR